MIQPKLAKFAHARTCATKIANDVIPEPVFIALESVLHCCILFIADDVVEKRLLLNSHPFEPHPIKLNEIKIGVNRSYAVVGGLGRKRRNQPLLVAKKRLVC